MSESEKRAWWILGVILVTAAAYFVFVVFLKSGQVSLSVFALTALIAFPGLGRRSKHRIFDERDREIANKALLASFRVIWLVFIGLVLAIGFSRGWDTSVTVPLWTLELILWWAVLLVVGVQALVTIVLYRRGTHA
jgi:magnesium-transporting ATPase (P-type)